MMTVLPTPDERDAHDRHYWRCDHCNAKLGEIIRQSVIIQAARGRIIIATFPVRQQCYACGQWNERQAQAA